MSGLPPVVQNLPPDATLTQASLFASVNRQFTPLDNGAAQGPPGQFPPPTVWVEEQHQDQMMITEHPVENGAPVSDHAFPRPVEVTIRLGWKGESLVDIQNTYTQLVGFKDARVRFDVMTGKRLYSSMLIQAIQVMTDERTAAVLLATVHCKQVILVNTATVPVPTNPQQHAAPSSTMAPIDQGAAQLMPGANFNPAGFPTSLPEPLT
jgi:hypothetical protein